MKGTPLLFSNRSRAYHITLIFATQPAARDVHDITVGTNSYAGVPGYAATVGWDATTGWGTPNGEALLPDLIAASREASDPGS